MVERHSLPDMNGFWQWALPELASFSSERTRRDALDKARNSSLSSGEYVVCAIWLVLAASLGRYILHRMQMASDAMATIVVNLFVVAPLLLAVFIPIHVRRLRRGLRQQLHHLSQP